MAARVEYLDPPRFPICDINSALGIDRHIVGQFELAWPRSSLPPFEQIPPLARELHHAVAGVPVGYVEIPVRCECHIRWQVEGVVTRARRAFPAQLQDDLSFRVHFVDRLAR